MNKTNVTEIANAIYHQLQHGNRAQGFPFKFSDAFADDTDSDTHLQVTVKKTSSYIYKFFVAYDKGSDTYSTRFGYMYNGNDLKRDDWCVFYITEWSHDIYSDGLITSLMVDWNNRQNKSLFHNIADESKVETVETSPDDEISDYEACLIAAGWI